MLKMKPQYRHLALLALTLLASSRHFAMARDELLSDDMGMEEEGAEFEGGSLSGGSLGGKKEAPLATRNVGMPSYQGGEKRDQGYQGGEKRDPGYQGGEKRDTTSKPTEAPKSESKPEKKDDAKLDLFGTLTSPFKISELTKFIFSPFDLVKSICTQFALPLDKFIDAIGTGLVLGVEALLYPMVAVVKIIEKVFVPDACRLKFFCNIGGHLNLLRAKVLKFTPGFLESSAQLKALTDGIKGENCETVFNNCELKLKKPFEDLRQPSQGSSSSSSSSTTSSYSSTTTSTAAPKEIKGLFGLL